MFLSISIPIIYVLPCKDSDFFEIFQLVIEIINHFYQLVIEKFVLFCQLVIERTVLFLGGR